MSTGLKRREPTSFMTSLLNSEPMGFYSPSQPVQDAQRDGLAVRALDVIHSAWDCAPEPSTVPRPRLHLIRLVSA